MTKHFSDFDSTSYYEQKCRNLEDKLSTAIQRIKELEHELQNKQFEAQSVPVGYRLQPLSEFDAYQSIIDENAALHRRIRELESQRMPEGWKLVPIRCPLCEYQHGHKIGCENNPVDIAMLAAAPKKEKK